MPVALQFDNGPPWGSVQHGRRALTRLACWLTRLDIEGRHIRPHHPHSNGKAERFHRTPHQEVIWRHTFSDLRHGQRVFDQWRADYNLHRPHEALAFAVPAARYPPSPRRFPERLPAVQYEPGVAGRKVSDQGTVHFKGQTYPIGKALTICGVASHHEGQTYAVYYCTQPIGKLTLRGPKMCKGCPRTGVNYVSGLYTFGRGPGRGRRRTEKSPNSLSPVKPTPTIQETENRNRKRMIEIFPAPLIITGTFQLGRQGAGGRNSDERNSG